MKFKEVSKSSYILLTILNCTHFVLSDLSDIETTTNESPFFEDETTDSKNFRNLETTTNIEDLQVQNNEDVTTILPIFSSEPNEIQLEVLNELENIWDFSESLSNSDENLKSSLTSLVHLTYARVQTEPEEKLDRVKYLLRKLREKLNINNNDTTEDESYGVKNSTVLRKKRSSEMIKTKEDDIDNLLNPNELLDLFKRTDNNLREDSKSSNPKPNSTTVQKLVNFVIDNQPGQNNGEIEEVIINDNILHKNKSNDQIKSKTEEEEEARKNDILEIERKEDFFESNSEKVTQSPTLTITPDQIASSIIKLLYNESLALIKSSTTTSTTTPNILKTEHPLNYGQLLALAQVSKNDLLKNSYFSKLYPFHTTTDSNHVYKNPNFIQSLELESDPIYWHIMSKIKEKEREKERLALKEAFYKFQLQQTTSASTTSTTIKTKEKIEATTTNTTPLPLPFYFQNILQNENISSQTTPKMNQITNPKNLTIINIDPNYDFEEYEVEDEEVEKIPKNETSVISTNFFQLSTLFEELSSGGHSLSLGFAPLSAFNGTKESVFGVIKAFNSLKFPAKMIGIFILSASLLSILIGLYALGPPIIGIGALGILLPIILLTFFQTVEKRRRIEKKEGVDYATSLFNNYEENIVDVLELIVEAIRKYE